MGTMNFISIFPLIRASKLLPAPSAADYLAEPTIYVPMITSAFQTIFFAVLVYYMDRRR
jgi:hypothetical protein